MRRAAIVILLFIADCHRPLQAQVPEVVEPSTFPRAQYLEQLDGDVFAINPGTSELVIEVERRGLLANFFGHNHVITSRELTGFIALEPIRADLYVPVASLRVDEPARRQTPGRDYRSTLSRRDIEATRDNMLSDGVLDAAHYPFITVFLDNFRIDDGTATAKLHTTVKDHVDIRDVALTYEREGASITADAQFQISHAELGLTPISILGGAITVDENLTVHVSVQAASIGAP